MQLKTLLSNCSALSENLRNLNGADMVNGV